ncbi:Acyltransferase Pun1 [Linum grandiflorum]
MNIARNPEVYSREMIKPSSQTPTHLKTHKLSLFDQFAPPIYVPILFFYPRQEPVHPNNTILKTSLSSALTKFYPLAGTIRGEEVDCNDKGVVFLQARTDSKLVEILEVPDDQTLKLLFPDGLFYKNTKQSSPLTVQVTEFDCGGMALAICVSHKILDMSSICSFVNYWADLASRNSADLVTQDVDVKFNLADLYPPLDLPVTDVVDLHALFPVDLEQVKCPSKRLVFDGSDIDKLKSIVKGGKVKNPTRVEVVLALIHSSIESASRTTLHRELHQVVNLRSRVVPPLPTSYVGNMFSSFVTLAPGNDHAEALVTTVEAIREAKTAYFKSCAEKCGGNEVCNFVIETPRFGKPRSNEGGNVDHVFSCGSWCGFPVYEANFGWGKPVWVTPTACEMKRLVAMMDSKDGVGIEAIVCLEEEEMAAFVANERLLAFCHINPSVV